MIGIDSNVLVRYLVQDEPRQAAIAQRFVERQLNFEQPGHISLITLAETIWVLQGRYDVDKPDLIPILANLASDDRFVVQEVDALWLALESCEQTDADLADALIHHLNQRRGCTHTVTFDRKATRLPGVVLLQ